MKKTIAKIMAAAMALTMWTAVPAAASADTAANAGTTAVTEQTDVKGSLVIAGGGLGSSNAEVYGKFIELAGGKTAKIGILPTASGKLASSQDFKEDLTEKYGMDASNIEVLPITKHDFSKTDENEAETWAGNENNAALAAKIEKLDGIWMVGGDQTLITDALKNSDGSNSKALDAMWKMYRDGGVIGGSSAGAAVMSNVMLAGGDSLGALRDGFIDMNDYKDVSQQEYGPAAVTAGLGFFPYGIVDQHFDTKARLGRLIMTAYEKGDRSQYAYGVDEDTALVYEAGKGTAEVVGRGGCAVVDVSKAIRDKNSQLTKMKGIVLNYLADGDSIDVTTRKITIEAGRAEMSTKGYEYMSYSAAPQSGALTPYGKLKNYLAYALVDNDKMTAVKSYIYDDSGRGFRLLFKKTADANGWYGSNGEKDVYSVTGVGMEIIPTTVSFKSRKSTLGYSKSDFKVNDSAASADAIKGSLVIAGGAVTAGNPMYESFLKLAGGKGNAYIGIIPAASGKLKSSKNFKKTMESLGVPADKVVILPIATSDYDDTDYKDVVEGTSWANDADTVSKINNMTGIWMVGGDQMKITAALKNADGTNTKALDAIWNIYKKGAVLGGSSAGAAVMSDAMFAGGDSLGTLSNGFVSEEDYKDMGQQEYGPAILADGLGFFRYGLVDQHFDNKARIGRLIAGQYEIGSKDQLAYGIDEDTALVVSNADKTASIVGNGGVMILNMKNAVRDKYNGYKDILVSHLKPGDTIDLATQTFAFSKDKYTTRGYEYNEYIAPPNSGVMSNHGVLKDFISYALTDNLKNNEIITYSFADNGAGFRVTFTRNEKTEGYWGYSDGQKDDYSFENVTMNIAPITASFSSRKFVSAKNEAVRKGVAADRIRLNSNSSRNHLVLSWNKTGSFKVSGYELYRAGSMAGTYEKAYTTVKNTYKRTDSAAKTGWYKVRGYRLIKGIKVYTSWSNAVHANI